MRLRPALLLALICLTQNLVAQPRSPRGRGGSVGPAVGTTIPNVELFDADGNPFRLGQLKGSYTVLVFGCLT